MWTLDPSDDYKRGHKWYEKKRPSELKAVLDNLDTFFTALKAGNGPQQVKAGFIHSEPLGVLAIDQKGAERRLAETRLYVYPDTDLQVLHLIAIGDKKSQRDDIALCKRFVSELRKGRASEHERKE